MMGQLALPCGGNAKWLCERRASATGPTVQSACVHRHARFLIAMHTRTVYMRKYSDSSHRRPFSTVWSEKVRSRSWSVCAWGRADSFCILAHCICGAEVREVELSFEGVWTPSN